MKLQKLFLPFLGGVLLIALAIGRFDSLDGKEIVASLDDRIETGSIHLQNERKRHWKEIPMRELLTISSTREVTLFGPLQLEIGSEGDLFVLDSGGLNVKRYAADGSYLRTYGSGEGQGPGEFMSITDFKPGPGDELWTADLSNGRLTIFGPNGEVDRTIRLDLQPYRLVPRDDGSFFLMYALVHEQLFGIFDSAGQQQSSFGTFLEDQGLNAMLLEGWIAPAPGGSFVYAAHYAGLIASYSAEGELLFLAEVLDRRPLPKMVEKANRMWVERDAIPNLYSLSVSSAGIHVLSTTPNGLKRRGTIDTYSLEDGRYLYSQRLPESCRSVVVTDDYLYTVGDTSLTR